MNTTEKGDELENIVFSHFKKLLDEGKFLSNSNFSKIYQKKRYYSKDREGYIIFDITIEVTYPGQEKFSQIYIIECKNYTNPISVDAIEEFYSKTEQIAPSNGKAIFVTNQSLQKGALNVAKSKEISYLRYFDVNKIDLILPRAKSNIVSDSNYQLEQSNCVKAIHNENFQSKYVQFYGFIQGTYTSSIDEFCYFLAHDVKKEETTQFNTIIKRFNNSPVVKYISKSALEDTASLILSNIYYKSGEVILDDICEYLAKQEKLIINMQAKLPDSIYGGIRFNPNIISINIKQAHSIKHLRFTLAHELSHLILNHDRYLVKEVCYKEYIDTVTINPTLSKELQIIEWQANYLASCILLPKASLQKEFFKLSNKYGIKDRGYGALFLDNQPCNQDTYYKITNELITIFNVSREALSIRLQELGILEKGANNKTKTQNDWSDLSTKIIEKNLKN